MIVISDAVHIMFTLLAPKNPWGGSRPGTPYWTCDAGVGGEYAYYDSTKLTGEGEKCDQHGGFAIKLDGLYVTQGCVQGCTGSCEKRYRS